MLRGLSFSLIAILAAAACCSCDMASTVRYSVAVGIDDRIDHMQVVHLDRKEQVVGVYKIAAEVASKYGLERCDGAECATWNLSCGKFKEKSCEEFAAPGGNVRGHGAPGMLIYTQDEDHVIILIRYFVGPSEPFKGMGLDLKNKIKNQPGVSVTVNLQ
jgi:hypothetical protein